jgi:hypothetical protein
MEGAKVQVPTKFIVGDAITQESKATYTRVGSREMCLSSRKCWSSRVPAIHLAREGAGDQRHIYVYIKKFGMGFSTPKLSKLWDC